MIQFKEFHPIILSIVYQKINNLSPNFYTNHKIQSLKPFEHPKLKRSESPKTTNQPEFAQHPNRSVHQKTTNTTHKHITFSKCIHTYVPMLNVTYFPRVLEFLLDDDGRRTEADWTPREAWSFVFGSLFDFFISSVRSCWKAEPIVRLSTVLSGSVTAVYGHCEKCRVWATNTRLVFWENGVSLDYFLDVEWLI